MSVGQLKEEAARLRLWSDEFVIATSLAECRWHFAPEGWPRLLAPNDPRRGILTPSRRADDLLLGTSRLALAEGDIDRATELSLAQLRFARHRLEWGHSESIYIMVAFAGAKKGAAHAARIASAIAAIDGKGETAARFADQALDLVRSCLARHGTDLRDCNLNQARDKIDLLEKWSAEEPLDERFGVVLLEHEGTIRAIRSFVEAFFQKGFGADAARLLAWAPVPDEDRVPFRMILCSDDAHEATARGRAAIRRVADAWDSDDWNRGLAAVDLDAEEDPTRVLSFLLPEVRQQAKEERAFRSEMTQFVQQLEAIANR